MPKSVPARLIGAAVVLLVVGVAVRYATMPNPGANAARTVTICHRTESASTPWVFMTVDEGTWPEHQAAGDIRASSLTDCIPPLQSQPAVVAPAQPSGRSQPEISATAQAPSPAQPAAEAPSPNQTASERSQQPALGESAAATAAGQPGDAPTPGPGPEVGVLPASGAPTADYTVTVLVLVALAGWGLYVRELGRKRT